MLQSFLSRRSCTPQLGKSVITIWGSRHWCQWRHKNGANGDPMAPMVMDVMATMEHPIAIGTNGDHHWIQLRSPLVINGAI
jgi:hypothetical protein